MPLSVHDIDGEVYLIVAEIGELVGARCRAEQRIGEVAAGIEQRKPNLALNAVGGAQFGHERNLIRLNKAVPAVNIEQVLLLVLGANIAVAIGEGKCHLDGVGAAIAPHHGVLGMRKVLDDWLDGVRRWLHTAHDNGQRNNEQGSKRNY